MEQYSKPSRLCIYINCEKHSSFGLPGTKTAKYCKAHKTSEMVDVRERRRCKHQGCNTKCVYGYPDKEPEFCKKHKAAEMVDLINKKCSYIGCLKQPIYGRLESQDKFCKEHKTSDMIDLRHQRCKFPECVTRPTFGFDGKDAEYCVKHKLDGMTDIRSKKCKYPGCKTKPTFGIPGKTTEFCKIHKTDEMIDLVNRKCVFLGCSKQPVFGLPGNKAQYCKTHKTDEMIDVNERRRCGYQGCKTIPTFGYKGGIAVHCAKHKLDDMIDVRRKKCKVPECSIKPGFGFPGTKNREYCFKHKLEGMIDICERRRCQYPECSKRASYGKLFQQKIHCATHKTNNEYSKNNPKCETKDCNIKPLYSDTNYPKRCGEHKNSSDTNIVEIPCKNCGLTYLINNSLGLCNDCFEYKEKKVHKVKEKEVIDFITNNGFKFLSTDRRIDFGCSNRRPDGVLDFGYVFVCLEIDEEQHKSYPCECEQGRMIQIHQDFGGSPVLFIRYNPDSYKDHLGKNQKSHNKRLRILLDTLKGIHNTLEREKEWKSPLSVIYLFYDGFDGNVETKEIDY